ncbi:hypothetical protein ABFX02_14G228800 [Erythranthe guttata]
MEARKTLSDSAIGFNRKYLRHFLIQLLGFSPLNLGNSSSTDPRSFQLGFRIGMELGLPANCIISSKFLRSWSSFWLISEISFFTVARSSNWSARSSDISSRCHCQRYDNCCSTASSRALSIAIDCSDRGQLPRDS